MLAIIDTLCQMKSYSMEPVGLFLILISASGYLHDYSPWGKGHCYKIGEEVYISHQIYEAFMYL